MSIIVDATFEGGVLKPKQPLALTEGEEVRVVISKVAEGDNLLINDPLAGVIGICEGPGISLAERHDEFLYGLRKPEPNRP